MCISSVKPKRTTGALQGGDETSFGVGRRIYHKLCYHLAVYAKSLWGEV